MIPRAGQVIDPGPSPEEMFDAFGPIPPADDEPTAAERSVTASRAEPGIGFNDAAAADDGADRSDSPDPFVAFESEDDTAASHAAWENLSDDASASPAESPSSEVAQREPPVVVPVRGYYIARTEDTLRSVAAQFLNAPERWVELRALNAAYPGIADLDPDERLPEGAALALPGDPLPWGRPDPVYLWTLAETFLYTAWGREPRPEEVVPFWRGLTQGALPEGEQPPPGTELPGIAEITARSAGDEDAAARSPAHFEIPAATGTESDIEIDIAEPAIADAPATTLADQDQTAVGVEAGLDGADLDIDDVDTGAVLAEEAETDPAAATPTPAPADEASAEPEAVATAEEAAPVAQVELEPSAGSAAFETEALDAAAASDDLGGETPEAAVAVDASADDAEEAVGDHGIAIADSADVPPPAADTAELAGLIQAVEEAIGSAEAPAADEILDAEIVEHSTAEPSQVESRDPEPHIDESPPVEPPVVEPPLAENPVIERPLTEPLVTESRTVEPSPSVADGSQRTYADPASAPPLEPPPTFEAWLDEPPPASAQLDPLAPYAGMPGASTAEGPPRPPEAEAPRVPHFLPSVTGTTPSGLTTPAQASSVGRSLAGTAVGDAMLLWQLARRRRQSRRAAGVPDSIEQSLLRSAGSEALELIEAAMRHLRAVTVGQQRPKPNVLAVRSGTYGFEVLLDQPVPTPPGWRAASGGYVLELPQGVTARDLGAIGQGPSLCPALVPVGNTFEGPLLLNLEQLGCLAISGPSSSAASLLSAIVSMLGSSPMADHLRITAVGLENSTGMIGWEAVGFTSYDSRELEALLANAYGSDDSVIDLLVIGPGNDLLIQRAGQIATAPESRLSVVGATSAVSARWPWRIHVDDTGTAVVHPISITMTAARAVPPETLAQFGGTGVGGIDSSGPR